MGSISYPRKGLNKYERNHEKEPAEVVKLTYKLSQAEIKAINDGVDFGLIPDDNFTFSVSHKYSGPTSIGLIFKEEQFLKHLVSSTSFSADIKELLSESTTLESLFELLEESDLNESDSEILKRLRNKYPEPTGNWKRLNNYIYQNYISPFIPLFLYFDEYKLLPGKVNLNKFAGRIDDAESKGTKLSDADKAVLGLLRLANIEVSLLTDQSGYETVKSRLEGLGIEITDKIFKYWKQNQNLEIEFDIKEDTTDTEEFNRGHNLYIRVKNKRHRVSVPFDQRSRGFVWFFSFIAWFDSVREQVGQDRDVILLLDEPGLNLHALGQRDLLRYLDDLAVEGYQIIYSTHSPFMVRPDRLKNARVVEDKEEVGTVVAKVEKNGDPSTIFPLQAALGYSLVQNLFVSQRNLLVEGPADLIYLAYFSEILIEKGREGLREDVSVVPCGGLDKVASFIALLGANDLEIAVLHDFNNQPDQRLMDLVKSKIISEKFVLDYADFRTPQEKLRKSGKLNCDVEDLIDEATYLTLFNATFEKELNGRKIKLADIPRGDRIIERLGRYLSQENIIIRHSGGFNHYRVASHLASHPLPPDKVKENVLSQFEVLFSTVNSLYSKNQIERDERRVAN